MLERTVNGSTTVDLRPSRQTTNGSLSLIILAQAPWSHASKGNLVPRPLPPGWEGSGNGDAGPRPLAGGVS